MQHSPKLQIEGLFRVNSDQTKRALNVVQRSDLTAMQRTLYDQAYRSADEAWFNGLVIATVGFAVFADFFFVFPWWVNSLAAFGIVLMIPTFRRLSDFAALRAASRAVMRSKQGS